MNLSAAHTERHALINQIKDLPAHLDELVGDLDDAQLDTPYRVDGWTVRQVVHHLADSHYNAFIRMKLALTEERPNFKTYDQNRWAQLPDTASLPLDSSLQILRGLHARWTFMLANIPEQDWTRTGLHPDNGEVTLADLLASYAAHGARHLKQIADLRRSRGW